MPLYKRKQFNLAKKPEDLKPQEDVFQVRFTNEIFRDYGEYLNRVNLYRQRVWTCKVTGKTNFTYEEALISEKQATEKIQQFPKDLVAPVLHEVQFSMLPMKDLVSKVSKKLLDHVSKGDKLHGKRNNRVYPCKIVKVVEEEAETERMQYEVAWLDKDNKITGNSIVIEEDLVRKKLPFSRDILKSFIRKSTYRSAPWVLHENLARKHGIPTDIPDDLKNKFVYQDGHFVANKKRNRNEECQQDNEERSKREIKRCRSKKTEKKRIEEPIKYPIDDLLVKPAADDPVFTDRLSPSRDFKVPMDYVGDLLMTWDFCSLFGRLMHLSPFSIDDFESALCYKNSNLTLIVESHSAFLRLLIKDEGEYYDVIHKKNLKPKITPIKWNDYLCDFLEMIDVAELCSCIKTIRRGHYGLIDIRAKLRILRELVGQAVGSSLIRDKLGEYVEQRKALGATKREEQMEAVKRKREKPSLNDYSKLENGDVTMTSNEIAETQGMKSRKKAHKNEPKIGEKQETGVGAAVGDEDNNIREQRKKYFEREMEKKIVRTSPLGKDRDHNRYWFFRHDERIFVESSDSSLWGHYCTKEELDALMGSLNPKGERERALKKQLEKYYDRICSAMQKRSKEVARKMIVDDADVRRSTRISALPREDPAHAFLKYVNKWKEE